MSPNYFSKLFFFCTLLCLSNQVTFVTTKVTIIFPTKLCDVNFELWVVVVVGSRKGKCSFCTSFNLGSRRLICGISKGSVRMSLLGSCYKAQKSLFQLCLFLLLFSRHAALKHSLQNWGWRIKHRRNHSKSSKQILHSCISPIV